MNRRNRLKSTENLYNGFPFTENIQKLTDFSRPTISISIILNILYNYFERKLTFVNYTNKKYYFSQKKHSKRNEFQRVHHLAVVFNQMKNNDN